ETHQLLSSHNKPRGCVMPEASRTARLEAIGLGEASCPLFPIGEMAHPGGFWITAVVASPSHNDSGVSVAEPGSNQALPALLSGGIRVAGGNSALTNG